MSKDYCVFIAGDEMAAIELLAKEQGFTKEEILRRAIAAEKYFHNERKKGSKVLVKKADGNIKEILFR